MPLNIGGDTDFTPYLKYNAKAGRFYIRPAGVTEDIEIVNPRLAIDMANIRTGWVCFQEGLGPEKVWDATLAQAAPRPAGDKKWKRGFEVMVFGPDRAGAAGSAIIGLREWSSNAGNANTGINKMYEAYEAGMVANPGKVPVYVGVGVTPITGAYGTNYEPRFELKSWVERSKVPAFDEYLGKQAAKPATVAPARPTRGVNEPPAVAGDPFGNFDQSPPVDDGFGQDVPF